MVDTLQQPTIGPEDRVVAALGSVLVLAAWSGPDGPMLASGGEDGTVRRWNATTGAPVGDPMTGHTGPVPALTAWSRPGRAHAGLRRPKTGRSGAGTPPPAPRSATP